MPAQIMSMLVLRTVRHNAASRRGSRAKCRIDALTQALNSTLLHKSVATSKISY